MICTLYKIYVHTIAILIMSVGTIASFYSYIATFFHIPVKVVASNKYAYTYIGIPEHGMLKYLLVLRNLAAQHIFERIVVRLH